MNVEKVEKTGGEDTIMRAPFGDGLASEELDTHGDRDRLREWRSRFVRNLYSFEVVFFDAVDILDTTMDADFAISVVYDNDNLAAVEDLAYDRMDRLGYVRQVLSWQERS